MEPHGLAVPLFEIPAARQHLVEVGRARAEDEAVRADDEALVLVVRRLGVGVGLLVGRGWPLLVHLNLTSQ